MGIISIPKLLVVKTQAKTIACNPTIPQKVTNVSIHDKGSEPSSENSVGAPTP